jgi:hypothetical protein
MQPLPDQFALRGVRADDTDRLLAFWLSLHWTNWAKGRRQDDLRQHRSTSGFRAVRWGWLGCHEAGEPGVARSVGHGRASSAGLGGGRTAVGSAQREELSGAICLVRSASDGSGLELDEAQQANLVSYLVSAGYSWRRGWDSVPTGPAPINDLGPIGSPENAKSTQNLSIRYKTGTAQTPRSSLI